MVELVVGEAYGVSRNSSGVHPGDEAQVDPLLSAVDWCGVPVPMQPPHQPQAQANLVHSGLTPPIVATALGHTSARLGDTLHISPAPHPADVWLLRDFLDQAVRDRGATPEPWTVLTGVSRAVASRWFSLRTAPPTPAG